MLPSRVVAAPFILAGIILLWFTLQDQQYGVYLVIPAVFLTSIYVLHPQIDWWWYRRNPPDLDEGGRNLLQRFFPFYQNLPEEKRLAFRQRVALIQLATDFSAQAEQDPPDDAKIAFAANQAQLTFGLPHYLIPGYEKVIFYPSAFPSPQYPEHFHLSETFTEETSNGYILSLQYMLAAFMHPSQYYNITMHELAQALLQSNPDWPWPLAGEEIWPKLEQISGFPSEKIKSTVNRPDLEPQAAMVSQFMVFPDRFRAVLPEAFTHLNHLLKTYV
jgi:hypothetical protein